MSDTKQKVANFQKEFIAYFENNIIGNPSVETEVENISHDTTMTNRGHGIGFRLKDVNFGPIFYAEELMKSLGERTIAEIAESVNEQIKSFKTINMTMQNVNALEPDENIILTALPLKTLTKSYSLSDVEYIKRDDIDLIVFLKTEIPNSPIPMAYGHVRKLSVTERAFLEKNAQINTLQHACLKGMATTSKDPNIPPMIIIYDEHEFADYFYLVCNTILDDIAKRNKFKKLYVFSNSVYSASIIGIPQSMTKEHETKFDSTLSKLIDEYYNDENTMLPVFKYNIVDHTFAKIDEDRLCN